MSILIDQTTRVLVVGITGHTARADVERSLRYGTRIVAGVSPGKGGEAVCGVPVYDTVGLARSEHEFDAAVLYVPAASVRAAVLEALENNLKLLLVTAEYVPLHDAAHVAAACRAAGALLIGCNTNGVISPGKSRIGGIGGADPDEIYDSGQIGVISRSGGMSAEISLALRQGGFGVSTCISMGGDRITGLRMADYAEMFADDPDTSALVVFGEPGTRNEQELAEAVRSGRLQKPVVALIAGQFQENYPQGMSFGHAAAMIDGKEDTATAKRRTLSDAGIHVCRSLDDIPAALERLLGAPKMRTPRPQADSARLSAQ